MIVSVVEDFLGLGAGEDGDDVGDAKTFSDTVDTGENFLSDESCIEGFSLGGTVIAGCAIVRSGVFGEILEEEISAADGALGEIDDFLELDTGNFLFFRVSFDSDKAFLSEFISVAIEENTFAW